VRQLALRRRRYPVGLAGRALLVSAAVIVPTVLASALIAAMMFWALPSGAALNERHVLLLNVVTASIYSAISIPSAIVWATSG
jgi:adenylate cyclase